MARCELAGVDHPQQWRQSVGMANTGVLEGVGLAPSHGGANYLAAGRAKPGVGVPCRHQRFEQRRLAGAGDAGQHRQPAALAESIDRRPLLCGEGDAGIGKHPLDRLGRECPGRVARRGPGISGQALFDPDLRGVADPHFVVKQPDHQGDVFASEPDAALFKAFGDIGDVVGAAGDAGADQPAGGVEAEFLMVDDGGSAELFGQLAGSEFVSAVKALIITQALGDSAFDDRAVLPAESGGLFAPDIAFVAFILPSRPSAPASRRMFILSSAASPSQSRPWSLA